MEGRHTVVLLMSLGLLTESRRNLLSKLTLRRQTGRPKGPFPRNMCVPSSVEGELGGRPAETL